MADIENVDAIKLFGDYMKVTGVPTLKEAEGPNPELSGKRLGVVNGSSWTSLWSSYFGQQQLPGVKIINVGNEAVQLNFMDAYHNNRQVPPQSNIDLFRNYAEDLYNMHKVDAVLISCSTMNRAFKDVSEHMAKFNVPVIQIDEAMMEEAVATNGKILVVATHGPTVKSTQNLLQETADKMGKKVDFAGATIEEAFDLLGDGDIAAHNKLIADTIKAAQAKEKIDVVVLAQLSMSVFAFSHPDPVADFGIPVLNSGQTGFKRAGEMIANKK